LATVSVPVSVSTPVPLLYVPVIDAVLVNASASSDELKPEAIFTTAPVRLAESTSPTATPLSTAFGPSPSV
jgi:hypothetical protein